MRQTKVSSPNKIADDASSAVYTSVCGFHALLFKFLSHAFPLANSDVALHWTRDSSLPTLPFAWVPPLQCMGASSRRGVLKRNKREMARKGRFFTSPRRFKSTLRDHGDGLAP